MIGQNEILRRGRILGGICAISLFSFPAVASELKELEQFLGLDKTISTIQTLEGARDPKCAATASRLEGFMYGTPLTDEARFYQTRRQKQMVGQVWLAASDLARLRGASEVKTSDINSALIPLISAQRLANRDWQVVLKGNADPVMINYDDHRHYATVAYALRAILANQLDVAGDKRYLPLTEGALANLREYLELASLSMLQQADREARMQNQYQITQSLLGQAWDPVLGSLSAEKKVVAVAAKEQSDFDLLRKIIRQKISSYASYNKISSAVFLRNIQVYFARYRWPKESEKSQQLKSYFNQAMVQFATDLYKGSEQRAMQEGKAFIRAEDVHRFALEFIPVTINEYEDATFFPRLPAGDRITLEAYDMDAFRDGGLHWQYLEAVIDQEGFAARLTPDPFAAELLVENIAQFGVLVLRMAGDAARTGAESHLTSKHIEQALRKIQGLLDRHAVAPSRVEKQQPILSTSGAKEKVKGQFFTDVTAENGIDFRHRMADWLNRFIRSYSIKNKEVAVLAVPPAFGGSGVATGDLNADGLPDILLVGGAGNRLYLNVGKGGFIDATEQAGLHWTRAEDGQPAEPRQPLIADFDNDGLADVFISYVNDDHRIYRNLGQGKFEDVTSKAGLGGKGLVGGPATTADFDNDGLLDLYITYFGQYTDGITPTLARRNDNGLPNKLFKNMGGFKFKDVTANSGVDNTGWTQAVTHTDFNRDGWQDLIVGNDFGVNSYLKNQGDGSFVDVAPAMGTDKPSFTMNVGIGDLNGDLHPDIYISNIVTMDKDQKYVNPSDQMPLKFDSATMARMRVVEGNDLFLSKVVATEERGYEHSDLVGRGYSSTGWSWGADFIDFDNDGDSDLYVTNGMNDYALYSTENPYYSDPSGKKRDVVFPDSQKDSNVFFENRDGRLLNVSKQSGVDLLGNSRAVAYLDMDLDGDMDMVLNNFNEPAVLFRNNAELLGKSWLMVKLIGDPAVKSNRDAIGARVILTAADGSTQWREVHGGVAYLAMHSKQQHFGLGDANQADIRVEWPNGSVSEFKDVQANQRYLIEQKGERIRPQ